MRETGKYATVVGLIAGLFLIATPATANAVPHVQGSSSYTANNGDDKDGCLLPIWGRVATGPMAGFNYIYSNTGGQFTVFASSGTWYMDMVARQRYYIDGTISGARCGHP